MAGTHFAHLADGGERVMVTTDEVALLCEVHGPASMRVGHVPSDAAIHDALVGVEPLKISKERRRRRGRFNTASSRIVQPIGVEAVTRATPLRRHYTRSCSVRFSIDP